MSENNSEIVDWNVVPSVEGEYVRKEEQVGKNKSNIYHFKDSDGDAFAVWGSTVLDSRLKEVEVGQKVKIDYLGLTKGKRGEYKNFEVSVWVEQE